MATKPVTAFALKSFNDFRIKEMNCLVNIMLLMGYKIIIIIITSLRTT